jgi:hypothetical protein
VTRLWAGSSVFESVPLETLSVVVRSDSLLLADAISLVCKLSVYSVISKCSLTTCNATTVKTRSEKHSPRIFAYEIHEWIHRELKLGTEKVAAIQIDGVHRQVFIKMTKSQTVDDIISRTKEEVDYAHETGEICKVTIGPSGLGKRSI